MAQYIYILVNPSLPGLLKIGKTTRNPEERAAELSSGTNMPTPFIVAYEEPVPNCDLAERLIHNMLAEKSYRVSDNREFFAVPLKTAIAIVSAVAEQLQDAPPPELETLSGESAAAQSSADYHYAAGMDAMSGTGAILQDYAVARKHFETAISLGSVHAHFFLANLYMLGNGVPQSAETALKILRAGGERGDPECFKTMWDIYAGNTVLDLRHEGNAELCFEWFLNSSGETVSSSALTDYLYHAYDNLGGEGKYPISRFLGKFVSLAIDSLTSRIRAAFQKVHTARIAGVDIQDIDSQSSPAPGARGEIIDFQLFASTCVQDYDSLMKSVMKEVTLSDLRYCFSIGKDPAGTIALYATHLPAVPSPAAAQQVQSDLQPPSQAQPAGFFRKLFSR